MSVLLMVELKSATFILSGKPSFMIICQFVPVTLSKVTDTTETYAAAVFETGTDLSDFVFQGVYREGSSGLCPEISWHCCVC
jgi:hypothetical protein